MAGNETTLHTYLEQSDFAHWLWTMIYGRDGETNNLGSGRVISITELALLVRDLLAPTKQVCIHGRFQPAGAQNRY